LNLKWNRFAGLMMGFFLMESFCRFNDGSFSKERIFSLLGQAKSMPTE